MSEQVRVGQVWRWDYQLTPSDLRAGMVFKRLACGSKTGYTLVAPARSGPPGYWQTDGGWHCSAKNLCDLTKYTLISDAPVTAPAKPTPRYTVGDRFVQEDGRFWTIVEEADGAVLLRDITHDDHWIIYQKDLHNVTAGFVHVSGPTFRVPAPTTQPSCNCSAQVTGSEHRSWCRTVGGGE